MSVTTVYLVRHAHADWSPDEGRGLSMSGRESAKRLSECLSDRPIAAVYSSPHQRAVETIAPLAERLGLDVQLNADLRERVLPIVSADEFHGLVERAWRAPGRAIEGGESNVIAQARGLAVIRTLVARHQGQCVVVATHGNLLAIILNGVDSTYGYEFWRELSFPDVYALEFEGEVVTSVQRIAVS